MRKTSILWSCVAAASIGLSLSPFNARAALKKEPILEVDFSKTPAFKEAEEVAKGFKVPKGLKISCFAAEPQLVSPVSITTDTKGRLYVIETFRAWGNGGLDMRKFPDEWYDDDLASRTVEDRVAWVTRRAGEAAPDLTLDRDRVRILEDVDGDGKADTAGIFSDGYNAVPDGIPAGSLAPQGGVFLRNNSDLYFVKGTKGECQADQKKVLCRG